MIDYTLPLEKLPDPLPIEPLRKPFDVTITPPGSKSITCRAYVLAALAEGESRIIRPLRAEDTDHLLKALCTLGAEARWAPGGEDVVIKGVAGRFPRGGSVYLGDGGTPTRFMIACACLAAEPVIVDASPRMRQRPIAEGVEMLRQLGAKIEYVQKDGCLPVAVVPSRLPHGGDVNVGQTQSGQFISAVLLIASSLPGGVRLSYQTVVTSERYVAMTYRMIREWGIRASHSSPPVSSCLLHDIRPTRYAGRRFDVEPDASSAVYWWAAAILCKDSRTITPGIGRHSNQPDSAFMNAFVPLFPQDCLDADISPLTSSAQRESTIARGPCMLSTVLDCENSPDCSVALAVVAAQNSLPEDAKLRVPEPLQQLVAKITGLRTLRVKETDRIAALANELRKVGCSVETGEDWIQITPPHAVSDDRREEDTDQRGARRGPSGSSWPLEGSSDPASVVIETYNDHRMAMAFAVLGLARPGISIRNPRCVAKSYPTFWKDFAKLYQ